MNELPPAVVSQRAFDLYSLESGGPITARTAAKFLTALGLEKMSTEIDIAKLKELIQRIDASGTLSTLASFRRFLQIVEQYLFHIGLVSPAFTLPQLIQSQLGFTSEESITVPTIPLSSSSSSAAPLSRSGVGYSEPNYIDMDAVIPGTQNTFRDLGDAFRIKEGATRSVCTSSRYIAVHVASKQLKNPTLGFNILNAAVRDILSQVDPATQLEEFFRDFVNEALDRSTVPAFQNRQRREILINAVVDEWKTIVSRGDNVSYGSDVPPIPARVVVGFPMFFVKKFFSPYWQTKWAEEAIRQSIEAYSTQEDSIDVFQPGQKISCPQGVIERFLLEMNNALNAMDVKTKPPASTSTQEASAPAPAPAPASEGPQRTYTKTDMTPQITRWYYEYRRNPEGLAPALQVPNVFLPRSKNNFVEFVK